MSKYDISVVATFHREREVAVVTLRCIQLCRQAAAAAGLKCELIAVLDSADEETRFAVRAFLTDVPGATVLDVAWADLGRSRNSAFAVARGEFGCTVDGDDLLSPNWLVEAHRRATRSTDSVVVHPEYVIEFGAGRGYTRLRDMQLEKLPLAACLVQHPWTSASFACIEAYRQVPYAESSRLAEGFGFEDWHWNLEQIAAGRLHVTAAKTFLLYRKRPGSLLALQHTRRKVIAPGRFFSAEIYLPLVDPEPDLRRRAELDGRNCGGPAAASARQLAWWRGLYDCLAESTLGSRLRARLRAQRRLPEWILAELRRLSRLDAAVPASRSDLAAHRYWELAYRTEPGMAYANILKALAKCGPASSLIVCQRMEFPEATSDLHPDAMILVDAEPKKGVVTAGLRRERGRGCTAVLSSQDADLTQDELHLVLVRILLQLHPVRVIFEGNAFTEEFLLRYAAALRSGDVAFEKWSAPPQAGLADQCSFTGL